jgi:hypothetical protein
VSEAKVYSEPRNDAAAARIKHRVRISVEFWSEGVRLELRERDKKRGVRFVLSISHSGLLQLLDGFNERRERVLRFETKLGAEARIDYAAAKDALEEMAGHLISVRDGTSDPDAIKELLAESNYGFEVVEHAISAKRNPG